MQKLTKEHKCNKIRKNMGEKEMFCNKCGKEVKGNVCDCGNPIQNNEVVDNGGFGWGLLGCCIPLVGLIVFIVNKKEKPKTAKAAGIGALISTIISIIIGLVFWGFVVFVGIAVTSGENGILTRAEQMEVDNTSGALYESMYLAISESVINFLRGNEHTIDNVLKIAVENNYITLEGSLAEYELVNIKSPTSKQITDAYVSKDCTSVTIRHKEYDIGVTIVNNNGSIELE